MLAEVEFVEFLIWDKVLLAVVLAARELLAAVALVVLAWARLALAVAFDEFLCWTKEVVLALVVLVAFLDSAGFSLIPNSLLVSRSAWWIAALR